MEGSSFLPALAKESLSVTKSYIILRDGPLQKLNFPSIYFQLSAVPVCSRGTMIYHGPEPAEQLSSLEVPAENAALQLLLCCQRLLPKGTQARKMLASTPRELSHRKAQVLYFKGSQVQRLLANEASQSIPSDFLYQGLLFNLTWEDFQKKKTKTNKKKFKVSTQQANKLGNQYFSWQRALQCKARCKLLTLRATACQLFFKTMH